MGMAFGMVSLLITVAIILYMMVGTGYTGAVAKQNKQMKQQVNVLGGMDPSGRMLATNSIRTHIDRTGGGKPKLIVDDVMADGPMQERYGLKPKDQIVEIGSLDVTMSVSNIDDATAFLHDAYARNQTLTVMRGGTRLTLPDAAHEAAVARRKRDAERAALPTPTTAPAATPAPAEDNRNPLQRALDDIRSTPGK